MRNRIAAVAVLALASCGRAQPEDPCGRVVEPCPTEGTSACAGDTVRECTADADGCLVWTPTETCEPGETCDDAEAGAACIAPVTYDVGWCILQYPPSVSVAVDEPFTVYARVYAQGLTDRTGEIDPAPELVVQVGYGLDTTDPTEDDGASWTWMAATSNDQYGPGAPDYAAANDEYLGALTIGAAGLYDFAARVSGDAGATWTYCDRDGLAVDGYTPEQAGDAEVGQ